MTSPHSIQYHGSPSEQNDRGDVSERALSVWMGQRLRRPLRGGALALMLVLAACGSSDSDGTKAAVDADKTAQASTADETSDSPEPSQGGTGTGTIEIGDVQHDLTVTRCTNMSGAIGGAAASVSEPDNVDVIFEFPPEDRDERPASEGWADMAPSVRLDSEDPYSQWELADGVLEAYNLPAEVEAQEITDTTFDISEDGQSVTGEGQFFEVNALLAGTMTEATTGTFSFSCPPKG